MSKFKKALMVTALATTLTGMSVAVMANTSVEPQLLAQHTAQRAAQAGAPASHMHGARDAGMGERMGKHREARLAKLKETLRMAPEQEAAWRAFVARTTPDVKPPTREEISARRDEWRQLSTPERLDRLEAAKVQRDAQQAKRHDAIRSLYASLTPEQQKVFDERGFSGPRPVRHMQDHRHGGHGMHHGHGMWQHRHDQRPQEGVAPAPQSR